MKDQPLSELHAVVTGGATGIGSAVVDSLAEAGARITIMSRTKQNLDAKVNELSAKYDRDFAAVPVDLTLPDEVSRAFKEAGEKLGSPEILINGSGGARSAPFQKTDFELWKWTIDLNLQTVFLCVKEVLPAMIQNGRGKIINIASTAGLSGYPYVAPYCAAKHGVIGLSRALAKEIATKGVTINCVCPSYTDTPMLRESIAATAKKSGRDIKEIERDLLKEMPHGRFVTPQEVAVAVRWLCLPEQNTLNGQSISIDGS